MSGSGIFCYPVIPPAGMNVSNVKKGGSLFNLVASAGAVKSYNINVHVSSLAFKLNGFDSSPKPFLWVERRSSDSSLIHFLNDTNEELSPQVQRRSDWLEIGCKIMFKKGYLANLGSKGNLFGHRLKKSEQTCLERNIY